MKIFIASIVLLSLISRSYGHHEIADDVNLGHMTHFGGIITGLEWAEPHVLIRIVGNPNLQNSPRWLIEVDSSTNLMSRGIDMSDFEILSRISIIGYAAKHRASSGEAYIHGLYLYRSPTNKILLNEKLFGLLPFVDFTKVIPTDNGLSIYSPQNY